jgi:hypothetical protein
LVLLVPLSCLLPLGLGMDGFLYSAPIADVLAFVLTASMMVMEYRSLSKEEKAILAIQKPALVEQAGGQR